MTLALQTDEAVDALTAVDARLAEFFTDASHLVSRHGPQFLRLWTEIEVSTVGGKRFRPALVIDTHRALGGEATDEAIATGTAVELLHTSFLLHDDVIDGDTVRRGRPNLTGASAPTRLSRGHDRRRSWRETCCCTPRRRWSHGWTWMRPAGAGCSTCSRSPCSSQRPASCSTWPSARE
jgi:geranylgeranyl diphosphate synthase type II